MSKVVWEVGERVAWSGPYDRGATEVRTVEKIYKTGHVVVSGRRFRTGYGDVAHETGDGYSRATIYKLDPKREAQIKLAAKRKKMNQVMRWLETKSDVASFPDSVLDELLDLMKEKP